MFDYYYFIIMAHMKKKKKKILHQQKLRHLPENDNSYLDTMTGSNSSNDRLILHQNVEINSNEYFLATYFFGNEIVDHVVWKRHCAITKKKCLWVSRVISTIYCGLSNDYRCKLSFNHHLLLLIMSFSFFFFFKLSVITEAPFWWDVP